MNLTEHEKANKIKAAIHDIPDFPQPGILFRDITPVLADKELFHLAVSIFAERYQKQKIDKIVAVEARGFILGAALAYALNIGFIPVRKPGKLPRQTFQEAYNLEYGNNTLEIHADCFKPGQRVVIIDDVLATGGTAAATAQLVQRVGGEVIEMGFLLELQFLEGRNKLGTTPVFSAIKY